jgi:hypothetical protein
MSKQVIKVKQTAMKAKSLWIKYEFNWNSTRILAKTWRNSKASMRRQFMTTPRWNSLVYNTITSLEQTCQKLKK